MQDLDTGGGECQFRHHDNSHWGTPAQHRGDFMSIQDHSKEDSHKWFAVLLCVSGVDLLLIWVLFGAKPTRSAPSPAPLGHRQSLLGLDQARVGR